MCIQLWFNKMSEGDLGQLLRRNITLYREPDVRRSAKWCGDIRSYSLTHQLHYLAHAVGGFCWWHFNGNCDLWYIICMSTPPWLERKQWDSHRQQTTKICLFMPEKQQRKTVICVPRKAPDAHSDLRKTQHIQRPKQKKLRWFFFVCFFPVVHDTKWALCIRWESYGYCVITCSVWL